MLRLLALFTLTRLKIDRRGGEADEFGRRFQKFEKDISGILGFIQLINSSDEAQITATESTTSTTFTDLATPGPEVGVNIGASGKVKITVQAFTSPTANPLGVTAQLGVSIDGGSAGTVALMSNDANNGNEITLTGFVLLDGLSIGPHTFKLQYAVSAGNTCSFGTRDIFAEPL